MTLVKKKRESQTREDNSSLNLGKTHRQFVGKYHTTTALKRTTLRRNKFMTSWLMTPIHPVNIAAKNEYE
jgi:hypothetical protein